MIYAMGSEEEEERKGDNTHRKWCGRRHYSQRQDKKDDWGVCLSRRVELGDKIKLTSKSRTWIFVPISRTQASVDVNPPKPVNKECGQQIVVRWMKLRAKRWSRSVESEKSVGCQSRGGLSQLPRLGPHLGLGPLSHVRTFTLFLSTFNTLRCRQKRWGPHIDVNLMDRPCLPVLEVVKSP